MLSQLLPRSRFPSLSPWLSRYFRAVFSIWRKRRWNWFLEILQPRPGQNILDVGGTPAFWAGSGLEGVQVVCLNPDPGARGDALPPGVEFVQGDGCRIYEYFGGQKFDIVFSNSVIEHLGSAARQKKFAEEVCQAGRQVWVQTPAYECPFEPHFLAPGFHWLPVAWRKQTARWLTPWGWMQRPTRQEVSRIVDEIRLLRRGEFRGLFPGCLFLEEKIGPLPKSYIAYRGAKKSGDSRPGS